MAYIGEIRNISYTTVTPSGWARCEGQILAKASNLPLFNVLGNRFGGDGVTTFALPDLRGRVPIGAGQGPGLSDRTVGESSGAESRVLSANQLPAHSHTLRATTANGVSDDPTGRVLARDPAAIPNFSPGADIDMAAGAVGTSGGSQPHNNMQPFLTVVYIIAIQGDVPTPG